jgi:hypothetical protein
VHSSQTAMWASAWRSGLAGKVARGAGSRRGRRARSRRGHRARDGAVVRLAVAQWRLVSGRVLPVSLHGPQGGRRARRSVTELTRSVTRHGRHGGALGGGSVTASRRQGATGELAWATGRTSGTAVGDGAHPISDAAWRQRRMLPTSMVWPYNVGEGGRR